jgi:hypothetical protein
VSTEAVKHAFTRVRPTGTSNPNDFFQGGSNASFSSGEAAEAASIVTPYMLEYGKDDPAIYLLSIIPLYVGIGRIKAQAHWQSDVVAGWAVGGLAGRRFTVERGRARRGGLQDGKRIDWGGAAHQRRTGGLMAHMRSQIGTDEEGRSKSGRAGNVSQQLSGYRAFHRGEGLPPAA